MTTKRPRTIRENGTADQRSAASTVRDPEAGTVDAIGPAGNTLRIRDDETGRIVVVRGAGAMADHDLRLETGIDLLQPIAEQILSRLDTPKAG